VDQRLKRAILAGTAIVIVASATACTSTPGKHPEPKVPPTSAIASPAPPPAPAVTAVAVPPISEVLLGQLKSQRGTNTLGPYTVTTDRIAVDVVCYGEGEIEVTLSGLGKFPMPCSTTPDSPGIRNTFDARYVESFSVQGQGDDTLLWGLSVTAIPNP